MQQSLVEHDGATLLAEIKMETNDKEDGLKGSIETRLAAREREQEALRKAIFHRLAEREAALKKAAAQQIKTTPQVLPVSSSSSSSSQTTLTSVNQEENTSDDNDSISNTDSDARQFISIRPGLTGGSGSKTGPWRASMRPNVQLEHVKNMRLAEEEELRRLQSQRLRSRKEETRLRIVAETTQRHQRSECLRAKILKGEQDKATREIEKRKEETRAQERITLQARKVKRNMQRYQQEVQHSLQQKMKLRQKRQQKARSKRRQQQQAQQKRQKELYRRLEHSSHQVKQRLVERRVSSTDHRKKDTEHRKRVEDYLRATKREQEENLIARELQRQHVLLQQEEKRKSILLDFKQMKIQRRQEAERRKQEQDQMYIVRKIKLHEETEQRMLFIEEEQERKKYVEEQLQEQLRLPNKTFRNFASNMLHNVGNITSVEELREAASLLEQQFKSISEQQRVDSWEVYSNATNPNMWSSSRSPSRSPSRPATSSSSTRRRRRPRTSNSTRPRSRLSSPRNKQSFQSPSPSRPSRPSSSSATRRRRPQTVGTPGRRQRHCSKPDLIRGSSRRKICALCRGTFGTLPHRVLRKAVMETRAKLGVIQPNIQRWRTAVYYDQVAVCQMCRQFVSSEFDGSSRYESNVAQGPVRKSREQVEIENENRLREQIHDLHEKEQQEKEQVDSKGSKQKKMKKKKQIDAEVKITVRSR